MNEHQILLTVIGAIIVAVICLWIVVVLVLRKWRDDPIDHATSQVLRGWMATGRINMLSDPKVMEAEDETVEANFVLRIEESRLVADLSGAPNVEIRWRRPMKLEAKEVVRRYHDGMPIKVDYLTQDISPFGGPPIC